MWLVWRSVTGAAALVLSVGAVQASTVDISGSGYFDSGTATTSASLAGHTFSFSFMTPNPTVEPGVADTDIIDPSFLLSDKPITSLISSVTFQDAGHGGLFDINFSDKTVLSFYGNYAIDQGGYLQPGPYGATVGVNGNAPAGKLSFGFVAVSTDVAPVPLPSSALLFGGALLGLGVVSSTFVRKADATKFS